MNTQFNIFRNLGLTELNHSKLLKKILHPKGKHSQKGLFLKEFLRVIGITNIADNDILNASIELEINSGRRGRVDMIIEVGEFRVIVENKARNAPFADNQLYRYWKNEIFMHYCNKRGLLKPNLELNKDIDIKSAYNKYISDNENHNYVLVVLLHSAERDIEEIKKASVRHPSYSTQLPETIPISIPLFTISYEEEIANILSRCLKTGFKTGDAENNYRAISVIKQYIEYVKSPVFGKN